MEIRHSEPEMKIMSKYIAKGNENHKVQNGDDIFVSRPSSLTKKDSLVDHIQVWRNITAKLKFTLKVELLYCVDALKVGTYGRSAMSQILILKTNLNIQTNHFSF